MSRDAFAVLMASQCERRLPSKAEGDKLRGDQRVRNTLIELLAAMSIGWSPDMVGTVGERCVKFLSASLWYIDPCRHQFHERGIVIPSALDHFEGFNDWKAKKEKKPQLSVEGLNLHLTNLTHLLQQSWLHRSSFKQLHDIIQGLANSFDKYRTYLQQQRDSSVVNRSSLTPCRTISESIELFPVPVVTHCKPEYSRIQQIILDKDHYQPILLSEFAPDDRHARKNWLSQLQLEVPAMMYRFMHGNNLGTLAFLWKTPKEGGEATSNAKLVTELNSRQKVYSTREMR